MTPTLYKELRAIKTIIENEIREAVAERKTPEDTALKLSKSKDIDVMKWVLAETVKANEWDARYSKKVKTWANQLYIPSLHGEDGRKYGVIDGPHPVHINQVIEAIMKF